MKRFVFRFDIDTPTCLIEGVPPLLALSEELGVRFTFFLSPGRSILRLGALRRAFLGKPVSSARAAGLSARKKLGLRRYVQLAILNGEIGRGSPDLVRRLAEKSDLGLHGGRNHDLWQHQAHSWSRARVEEEIDWGLEWLRGLGIEVHGFCSPGWTQPPDLSSILVQRGFLYRADRHGADGDPVVQEEGLANLNTNILGEPGGVAYLEHLRALGLSDAEIRDDFRARLRRSGDYAAAYDHPYFAGRHALGTLRDLVGIAQGEGFQVTTMTEVAASI